ncbi:carboxylating nicotinate-nucleotide diphosphorylase [Ignatzschineria cameli]|uniref:Probable nicotinate-nucleotide pyrophosphorylase [carboxylating] n=1 Tax=Ignatzschineria cameli TaxID=2182793 RepID=A0A2U2ATY0_9GAMM|nr:carboxylating nicotinate-nucleotide diphosphorylase [Ignatzschineria cameli]PWD87372.1 carboxylating nicotinate-nucleotide diphosphorylase [Ignatzschineria cameli]PWD88135.1 carboxylating nicotinate-nucleotide diphosphorylase [Ignatzschineria cameli]PWD91165.1 carboxylating nicotinate-nucleotide diphosphorylase [Ignatzschineria cameli]PWD92806.1 carboxylating nicotinate-nucleotide diphosphorylase [Ignatzschineria cameli]PWD93827.1 carboxylating nicotinate-nucleotide diphosphorylase [Ignatzs
MTSLAALPTPLLRPFVQQALEEDLGRRGDLTSAALIEADRSSQLQIVARESGVIAGMDLAQLAFQEIDPSIRFTAMIQDGDAIEAGAVLAEVSGNARALLTAERTALNFLTHLSGIATEVATIKAMVADYPVEITCTRKTIPGLRVLQKYAVRAGGGRNHRMGLDDAILIKDNHIAIAGDITTAIQRAKAFAGHLIPVEVEVDTLAQLELALKEGVNLVLLDNMSPDELREAVKLAKGICQTEASGGISPQNVVEVAQTGVDFIAMGWITHSVKSLDIGLDYNL